MKYRVLESRPEFFESVQQLCRAVYPTSPTWGLDQLASHHHVFPAGQLVAQDCDSGRIVGMAASLILSWDDYDWDQPWRDFTDNGYFTNHDNKTGRTLYGAEIMVDPALQGRGIGKLLYKARRELAENLGLIRIRAGARLRGYSAYAKNLGPITYTQKVIRGEIFDPTVSFQLTKGFHVLRVVSGYLRMDPESRGFAAIIEWLNPKAATPAHLETQTKMRERFMNATDAVFDKPTTS